MNFKALLAEFIGTFTLIFIGVGAIAANSVSGGALGLTGIALAHGLAIAVMVSATGAISGGNLNPAVSLGLLMAGKLKPKDFGGYVIAQCLGAVFAAMLIRGTYGSDVMKAIGYGTPALGKGIEVAPALLAEIVLTFFLVFVVFGTAVDARAPKVGGLFIGLTVALDIMCGGPISGGAMNPARWLGPAIIGGGMQNAIVYIAGPLCGGALAAVVYKLGLEKTA